MEKPERCAGAELFLSGVIARSELLLLPEWKWAEILRERSVTEEVREEAAEDVILRVQEWATQPWAERVTRPSATGCRNPMACTKPAFSRMDWKMGRRQARISAAAKHAVSGLTLLVVSTRIVTVQNVMLNKWEWNHICKIRIRPDINWTPTGRYSPFLGSSLAGSDFFSQTQQTSYLSDGALHGAVAGVTRDGRGGTFSGSFWLEGSHGLGDAGGEGELLTQLHVGPSLCWMGRVRDVLRNKDFYLTRKGESKSTKATICCFAFFSKQRGNQRGADENET